MPLSCQRSYSLIPGRAVGAVIIQSDLWLNKGVDKVFKVGAKLLTIINNLCLRLPLRGVFFYL